QWRRDPPPARRRVQASAATSTMVWSAKPTRWPTRSLARLRFSGRPSTRTWPASTAAWAAPPESTKPQAFSSWSSWLWSPRTAKVIVIVLLPKAAPGKGCRGHVRIAGLSPATRQDEQPASFRCSRRPPCPRRPGDRPCAGERRAAADPHRVHRAQRGGPALFGALDLVARAQGAGAGRHRDPARPGIQPLPAAGTGTDGGRTRRRPRGGA